MSMLGFTHFLEIVAKKRKIFEERDCMASGSVADVKSNAFALT